MTSTELAAARLLLDRLGITPEQLLGTKSSVTTAEVPTIRRYLDDVAEAVPTATRTAYGPYWRRVAAEWGDRRIDEVTPLEIKQLAERVKADVVVRRNSRGGRSAAEHLISALRCLYRHAVSDGLITEANNPAIRVSKPRRLASTRRAIPDAGLAEILDVAGRSGNDPDLNLLILRLHVETACRRGGALALRPVDLDPDQCLIRLREKGETVRWQPVSPTLMSRLADHHRERSKEEVEGMLLYRGGRPITTRRYDHHPPIRPPVEADRRSAPLGGRSAGEHPLAATHDPDLGGAQLRLRRRPGLRGPQRAQRRGQHVDVRPSRRARGGVGAVRSGRGTAPACCRFGTKAEPMSSRGSRHVRSHHFRDQLRIPVTSVDHAGLHVARVPPRYPSMTNATLWIARVTAT